MRILIDVDDIVAGCMETWLEIYNQKYRGTLTMDDWDNWAVKHVMRNCTEDQAFSIIHEEGFFFSLPVLDGAIDGVAELLKDGHDVSFCTQPANAQSAKEKILWIEKHFGHLGFDISKIIQMSHKSWLVADVMIDDRPKTIMKWAERIDFHPSHPNPAVLSIAYPFNDGVRNLSYCHADGYKNTLQAWEQLVQAVRELAEERKEYAKYHD